MKINGISFLFISFPSCLSVSFFILVHGKGKEERRKKEEEEKTTSITPAAMKSLLSTFSPLDHDFRNDETQRLQLLFLLLFFVLFLFFLRGHVGDNGWRLWTSQKTPLLHTSMHLWQLDLIPSVLPHQRKVAEKGTRNH